MIIHRCDRCGVDGDVFTRHLEVSTDGPVTTIDPRELDLCGLCWTQFRLWITAPRVEAP